MASGANDKVGTRRSAGILLHPTSLPGGGGVGELGPGALRFVQFLGAAEQRLWQVLPLGPTDAGNSPYSSPSAFAGNSLLISTAGLVEDGLLKPEPKEGTDVSVDYPAVIARKTRKLREAHKNFVPDDDLEKFREKHRGWLEDYALFAALKGKFKDAPWNTWPTGLAERSERALERARRELEGEILFHEFAQYRFFKDWGKVKCAANAAGIEIVGDLPIFVSHDSADVWANRDLFYLDEAGVASVVAGVPPDYFSETGQLWGNPLYNWERVRAADYRWWTERMRMALTLYDAVRIDHFRGFESYWEIPAGERSAANGQWQEGPGTELFEKLRGALGPLPIIAEDLGEITPAVEALRDSVGVPGMKVLQFAFSDPDSPHLPHNFAGDNWIVYTGTHDNDTTSGWWTCATPGERAFARRYLGRAYVSVWDLVRLAHSSVAERAIVPMQDVLELGPEARMNRPGTTSGNWEWRLASGSLTSDLADRLRTLTVSYGR